MNQKTIFIAEDDQDLAELIRYNLEKEGYSVKQANSGLKGLWSLSAEERPDCILLDWMMPSPDGLELCHFLKSSEDYRDIPLIMISAKNSPEDIEKALELGADAYLPKPFSIEHVKKLVKRYCIQTRGSIRIEE